RLLGLLAERAEPSECCRTVSAVVAPGLEMVGDGDRIEAELLRQYGVVEQLARPELLRRRLVAERQRHACSSARSAGVSTSKARPGRSTMRAARPAAAVACACTAALD